MFASLTPLQCLAQAATAVVEEDLHIDEGFELMVVGMGVVFTALVLIMIMMIIIRAIVKQANQPAAAPVAPKTAAAAPGAPVPAKSDDSAMKPETAVLLTAAVAAVVKRPFRIRQVAQVVRNTNAWAEHGRSVHHRSHRVRKGLK